MTSYEYLKFDIKIDIKKTKVPRGAFQLSFTYKIPKLCIITHVSNWHEKK